MGDDTIVTLKIDGREVRVPKGTNLIEAAKTVGIDIPHYCYHKYLSIAGNCRMCQVEVKGQPKMTIACNTGAAEGMEVATHLTSQAVSDAQKATLEFILINHPMDCTICDQSGQCKLQDYHYKYSGNFSRFEDEKEHKVKAEVLGPHVILDGERCIMCTRCIRFCDEVTKTSELGMLNRGDKSVIAVNPGKVLDNPLSGTVNDLCPVGALTHRDWRFNTRIWFAKHTSTICPGCSTGCNARVSVRDGEVVQVKGRFNEAVNKEWMCDEGRYGFHRFLPERRILEASVNSKPVTLEEGLIRSRESLNGPTGIFVSSELLLEEYELIRRFFTRYHKGHYTVALAYRERELMPVQAILVSPDYAPNFRGAEFAGVAEGNLQAQYEDALEKLRKGVFKNVMIIGDRGIFRSDIDDKLIVGISRAEHSVGLMCDADTRLRPALKVLLPARSILEKSGLMVNRKHRLQYFEAIRDFPQGTEPHWRLLNRLAELSGGKLTEALSDRDLTLWYLESERRLSDLSIAAIKAGGIDLGARPVA